MPLTNYASFFGLDQQSNPQLVAPESSSDLLNVKLHPVGSVGSREGYTVFESPEVSGTDAPTQIDGLATLQKIAADRIVMYAFTPGHIYRTLLQAGTIIWEIAKTYSSSVADLAHITATAQYEDNGECLYIADGSRLPMIDKGLATASGSLIDWPAGDYDSSDGTKGYPNATVDTDGPEWRDWSDDPPSGLILRGEGRQERIYAWGFADDPNRIDYSELGVPWNMLKVDVDSLSPADSAADGGWFYAIADDQDYVVSVVELYDKLIVLKRNRTLIYNGIAGSYSVPLKIDQERPVGCVSHRSVVKTHNDLWWMSDYGPVSLSGVVQYGDLIFERENARKIREDIGLLNMNRLDKIVAYHEPEHARIVWFCPCSGADDNNRAFVFYYDHPRWSRWTGSYTEVACVHVGPGAATPGDAVYAGDYSGDIRLLNTGTQDGDDDIDSYWTSQWIDMGDSDKRKRLKFLDLIVGAAGVEAIDIKVAWDYSASVWVDIDYIIKIFGEPAAYWDYAKWDEAVWDAQAEATMRWDAASTGHLAMFKFAAGVGSDGVKRPFQIMGWKPVASVKGTR